MASQIVGVYGGVTAEALQGIIAGAKQKPTVEAIQALSQAALQIEQEWQIVEHGIKASKVTRMTIETLTVSAQGSIEQPVICATLIHQLGKMALEIAQERDRLLGTKLEKAIEGSESGEQSPPKLEQSAGDVKELARKMRETIWLAQSFKGLNNFIELPTLAGRLKAFLFNPDPQQSRHLESLLANAQENMEALQVEMNKATKGTERLIGRYDALMSLFNQRTNDFGSLSLYIGLGKLMDLKFRFEKCLSEMETVQLPTQELLAGFKARIKGLTEEKRQLGGSPIVVSLTGSVEPHMSGFYTYGDALHRPPAIDKAKEDFDHLSFDKLKRELVEERTALGDKTRQLNRAFLDLFDNAAKAVATMELEIPFISFTRPISEKMSLFKEPLEKLESEVEEYLEANQKNILTEEEIQALGKTLEGFADKFAPLLDKKKEMDALFTFSGPEESRTSYNLWEASTSHTRLLSTWKGMLNQLKAVAGQFDTMRRAIDAKGFGYRAAYSGILRDGAYTRWFNGKEERPKTKI